MSQDRNAGRSHNLKIDNSSFESVNEFKHSGTTLTNRNSIQEQITSRVKSGNVCFHSVHYLLSSSLLSKNLKFNTYRTIILPVVLYGCETWLLTLGEECRMRVLENRMLRRIFGPKRDKVKGEWRTQYNEELNDLYFSPRIVQVIKLTRMKWAGHAGHMVEKRAIYRVFVGKPVGKSPLGRPRRRWWKWDVGVWTGSM